MNKKKTKIVATIGPSSEDERTLSKMIKEGLNIMRLNFSHGDFNEHQKRVDIWRKIAKQQNKNLGILQDLSGPKIRIGDFETEKITLKKNSKFIFTTEKIKGTKEKAYVNYPLLVKDLKKGDNILLDDGKLRLEVEKIKNKEIITKVLIGGEIRGRRGVNLPGANLKISALTPKDKKDLDFAAKNNIDFVALSFVRSVNDIRQLRSLMKKKKIDAEIISKIETQQAVDNIDEIINETDGVMVARGDLAIEIGPEKVPSIQKMIIRKCNDLGKPVITATQMLESMINNPVPTRAEVSDIANAILDGTDAVMLSGETTVGEYPVEVVKVMTRTALETELRQKERNLKEEKKDKGVVDSITQSATKTAKEINASVLVALTKSGFTGRMISRFKPKLKILSFSPYQKTCNQVSLSFGCQSIKTDEFTSFDEAMEIVRKTCLDNKIAKKGDSVVVVAGVPFSRKREKSVETNMILVEKI
ncbi:MAG: pyruvate kinase [Candidatus Paceibacterota bacterium]